MMNYSIQYGEMCKFDINKIRFPNNIGIKIKEMRILKLHILTTTNISFGTKRKFKIKRMIRYS